MPILMYHYVFLIRRRRIEKFNREPEICSTPFQPLPIIKEKLNVNRSNCYGNWKFDNNRTLIAVFLGK